MQEVIAIGALGGSGTRVVAQILIEAGIYLGSDLNHANDNLLFTRLFKNPQWHIRASKKDIDFRLKIFEKLMRGHQINLKEEEELGFAMKSNPTVIKSKYTLQELIQIHINNKNENQKIWGWKEPNTHVLIECISNYFPKLKYIYVIRHGLDMAFSKNKQQLHNWGDKYKIELTGMETEDELAVKQLDFWIKSANYVIEKGKELLGSNLYVLKYENLCTHSDFHVSQLFKFLEFPITSYNLNNLKKLPQLSANSNRFLKHDLSIFRSEQLNAVERLGFTIT